MASNVNQIVGPYTVSSTNDIEIRSQGDRLVIETEDEDSQTVLASRSTVKVNAGTKVLLRQQADPSIDPSEIEMTFKRIKLTVGNAAIVLCNDRTEGDMIVFKVGNVSFSLTENGIKETVGPLAAREANVESPLVSRELNEKGQKIVAGSTEQEVTIDGISSDTSTMKISGMTLEEDFLERKDTSQAVFKKKSGLAVFE